MYWLIATTIFILQGASPHFQPGWELKRDREGIVIHTREAEGSPLKEYRVSAVIDRPIGEILPLAMDLESRPDWVVYCTGLEIIDTVAGRIRYHTAYDMPWPAQDRDLVVELEVAGLDQNVIHLITRSIDLVYPKRDGVVRMPRYREEVYYEKLDAGRTNFRAEGFADPGGNIPAWVVNMFLVDGTYESVVRIRNAASGNPR